MKVKQQPSDFRVDEVSHFELSGGEFAVYRLEKKSLGTPEAINAIVDRWRIPRRRVRYGGLKDKHAQTSQTITIRHGPKRPLSQKSFSLTYLGQANRHFQASDIQSNRFGLVVRDLTQDQLDQVRDEFELLQSNVLPNYFDDQRFGSLGLSGEWIAKSWCLGDYERALWLALADTHPNDRSKEKQQKQILQEHWGEWSKCKSLLDRSHRRSIVTFLSDKETAGKSIDFRGAFARINVDLRGLYLSAFQSAIWNRMLSKYIEEESQRQKIALDVALNSVSLKSGWACIRLPREFTAAANTLLPLPSARLKLEPDDPSLDLINRVLDAEEMQLRQMRVKYPRDSFFSKASRSAFIEPSGMTVHSETDTQNAEGRQCLHLGFELPRGSYATILIKRITMNLS